MFEVFWLPKFDISANVSAERCFGRVWLRLSVVLNPTEGHEAPTQASGLTKNHYGHKESLRAPCGPSCTLWPVPRIRGYQTIQIGIGFTSWSIHLCLRIL